MIAHTEQMTATEPRVSAEESFLMTAFLFTKSLAPKAGVTAVMAGMPSGTAEIASESQSLGGP